MQGEVVFAEQHIKGVRIKESVFFGFIYTANRFPRLYKRRVQIVNIDYRQFYRGTTNIPLYGSGAYKKDTLVKYEFNTTDEHGNKIMDKMSKEETLQAMKDIRSQYGDSVIVEFSGDGLAALAEDRKDSMAPEDREAMEARNAAFQKDIVQIDKSLNNLPAYSGKIGRASCRERV